MTFRQPVSALATHSAFLFSLAICISSSAQQLTPAQSEFFESKIRPIFVNNCYPCHSPQAPKIKCGLLLDTRSGILAGGDNGPAIVPGDPDKSLLIKAVSYTDQDLQMPPKNKKLSEADIASLISWVKMGAPDPRVASAGGTNQYAGALSR